MDLEIRRVDTAMADEERLKINNIIAAGISTPAFIYDKTILEQNAHILSDISAKTGIKFTYSIKASAVEDILKTIISELSGFSVSSLAEARHCKAVLQDKDKKSIHVTSPLFIKDDIFQLAELCDYMAFNSISQIRSFSQAVNGKISWGVRINPGVSFVSDERYDPCRRNSKLGVPIEDFFKAWSEEPSLLKSLEGLHFHTNYASSDYEQLHETIEKFTTVLDNTVSHLKWLNLGGGYYYNSSKETLSWLKKIKDMASRQNGDLEIFMEPGEFLVGEAGYLASRIRDIFESGGKRIAILDTSINHLPECFEYQFEPDVLGSVDDGDFEYIIAGASCLAGDLFGEYCFEQELSIGDLIIFEDVGAYSLVKANNFTGIPLPAIYMLEKDEEISLHTESSFAFFDQLWRKG